MGNVIQFSRQKNYADKLCPAYLEEIGKGDKGPTSLVSEKWHESGPGSTQNILSGIKGDGARDRAGNKCQCTYKVYDSVCMYVYLGDELPNIASKTIQGARPETGLEKCTSTI